jgi:hypothetical protein
MSLMEANLQSAAVTTENSLRAPAQAAGFSGISIADSQLLTLDLWTFVSLFGHKS